MFSYSFLSLSPFLPGDNSSLRNRQAQHRFNIISHFSILGEHFQLVTICDQFASFVFQAVFQSSPICFHSIIIQLLSQNSDDINHEALHDIFTQFPRGPDPKLRTPMRMHPITHRNDDVEIIIFNVSRNSSPSLFLNSPEIPDSWILLQFPFFINIPDVFRDRSHVFLEQPRHLNLGKPDRLALQTYFDFSPAVFRYIKQDWGVVFFHMYICLHTLHTLLYISHKITVKREI